MINISRATQADAEILAELGRTTFIQTFAKDNLQENMDKYVSDTFGAGKQLAEIRDPNRWIEIAWTSNEPAGFMHLVNSEPDESVTGSGPIELLRIYVDSRWHGQGVGAALMERCIEIARLEGFQTLWLGVWERNFRAQTFYEKFGFEKVGQHVFTLGFDDQTDFILSRTI